jgi:energy-coupling factor transporter ATP-binding protein EcfA2
MKLKSVRVKMFRNFLDSTDVEIDREVTALVGKNESGKSSFLTALARLLPATEVPGVFATAPDYPAWLEKQHRRERGAEKLAKVAPITATFTLDGEYCDELDEELGAGVVFPQDFEVSRTYENGLVESLRWNEARLVAHLIARSGVAEDDAPELFKARSVADVDQAIAALRNSGQQATANAVDSAVKRMLGDKKDPSAAVWRVVARRIPRFFYFANYTALPERIPIRQLVRKAKSNAPLNDSERASLALLRLAASDDEYLLNTDYELRKRELENVANALTEDMLRYWTQNPELRVLIDVTQVVEAGPHGQQTAVDQLMVRMYDERHRLSLPFGSRSSGFQWFFSFLAAFSEFEREDRPMVILLDEPAHGLHARAQADFLHFVEERLAPKHQVIYTTHSPFMVQPGRLERVRLVEDAGRERGAVVSNEVLTKDKDTVFPLQAALGYDLAQHLFVAPHSLVVEGSSDFTYLTLISEVLRGADRIGLDERWSIVPVGGADMVPTFVSLLGKHVDVTVLVDSQRAGHQKLERLIAEKLIPAGRTLMLGPILGKQYADIEDAFDPDDYLKLYNGAFGTKVKPKDLVGTDPIVARLARYAGVQRFDHGKPADFLLRNRDKVLPALKSETLDAFEKMFGAINATLRAD